MKYYLSSYKFGKESEKLASMAPLGEMLYISNALDITGYDEERKKNTEQEEISTLTQLGLKVEQLDLREYFGEKNRLKQKLVEKKAVFIRGGNVFVLRQAMNLSGMDEILNDLIENDDFLYSGFSAAGCVLAPTLDAYKIVDDSEQLPYQNSTTIMQGLGHTTFCLMPHWDSDHPESKDIDKEIEYCIANKISYKAIRDGEVLIF